MGVLNCGCESGSATAERLGCSARLAAGLCGLLLEAGSDFVPAVDVLLVVRASGCRALRKGAEGGCGRLWQSAADHGDVGELRHGRGGARTSETANLQTFRPEVLRTFRPEVWRTFCPEGWRFYFVAYNVEVRNGHKRTAETVRPLHGDWVGGARSRRTRV